MSKDLFYKSHFLIKCIPNNKVKPTTFVDTYAIRYSFIDKTFVKKVC